MSAEQFALLELAERDAYFRLASDPNLSQRTILLERDGATKRQIIAALETADRANKVGAVLVVLLARFDVPTRTVSGPQGEIIVGVRALISRDLVMRDNGANTTADALAAHALNNLHLCDGAKPLLVEEKAIVPFKDWLDDRIVGAEIGLRKKGGLPGGNKTATPVIATADAGGGNVTVTLSCSDGGAILYRTTDGSYPGSGNPAASAYAMPFAVPAGTFIRVGAQSAPALPSDPVSKTV